MKKKKKICCFISMLLVEVSGGDVYRARRDVGGCDAASRHVGGLPDDPRPLPLGASAGCSLAEGAAVVPSIGITALELCAEPSPSDLFLLRPNAVAPSHDRWRTFSAWASR